MPKSTKWFPAVHFVAHRFKSSSVFIDPRSQRVHSFIAPAHTSTNALNYSFRCPFFVRLAAPIVKLSSLLKDVNACFSSCCAIICQFCVFTLIFTIVRPPVTTPHPSKDITIRPKEARSTTGRCIFAAMGTPAGHLTLPVGNRAGRSCCWQHRVSSRRRNGDWRSLCFGMMSMRR